MSRAVGFIGLGVMGAPMAGRLVAAGHKVTVYNRTSARCEPLVALGAKSVSTPRAVAEGNEIIFSVVTDGSDVQTILLGPEGATLGAAPGTIFVDMSTIDPKVARGIGDALSTRGFGFLDAPVTGGDVGAREGTLSILVGGHASHLERVRDVLGVMGKRITHCGPQGAGQAIKACNQVLCALNMLGVVEALHLARSNGIDEKQMVEALVSGAGGSWALEKLGPRLAARDFAPGFMIKLMQKDLRIVRAMAAEARLALDGVALAQTYFADNERHGEGHLGTQAMYKVLERGGRTRTDAADGAFFERPRTPAK